MPAGVSGVRCSHVNDSAASGLEDPERAHKKKATTQAAGSTLAETSSGSGAEGAGRRRRRASITCAVPFPTCFLLQPCYSRCVDAVSREAAGQEAVMVHHQLQEWG